MDAGGNFSRKHMKWFGYLKDKFGYKCIETKKCFWKLKVTFSMVVPESVIPIQSDFIHFMQGSPKEFFLNYGADLS